MWLEVEWGAEKEMSYFDNSLDTVCYLWNDHRVYSFQYQANFKTKEGLFDISTFSKGDTKNLKENIFRYKNQKINIMAKDTI